MLLKLIKILSLYFLFIILVLRFIPLSNNIRKGLIKCIDKDLYVTCIFKNIYFINNKWIIYGDKSNYFNRCINAYSKMLGKCWKFHIYSYNLNRNKNVFNSKVYNDISIPFKLTYTTNYGHALWDDLYSVYTSVVKSGYANERINLVMNRNYRKTHYLDDILFTLQKFSKGKNIYLQHLSNKTVLFKTVIVGSSHQCQRCVTPDYSLKYSREYNVTKLIRDRMYNVFNIKAKFSYPIEGIIVHNKRYSAYEIDILKKIVKYFKKSQHIRLYYVDYKNITTFYEQLKLLSRIHIYISGPGTGLLNFPFMTDPGIVIHLGHIHFGCPQYLEQYILEGTSYIKAIYYSPQMRMKKLNFSYIISLINLAKKYILNNNVFNVKKEENLNDIGKLYVKICKEHNYLCNKLIDKYDWGYGKCRGIWAENVIFFPSLYKHIPELQKIIRQYNVTNNLGCMVGINYSKQKQCNIY